MDSELPQELRSIVSQSVALLGTVLRRELGERKYDFIENLRSEMVKTRVEQDQEAYLRLKSQLERLRGLDRSSRREVAYAFTIMLEVMNACENAYRSHRLSGKAEKPVSPAIFPESVIYVLTAHPTEARSPENIAIFHQIQNLLLRALDSGNSRAIDQELPHWLEIAWRVRIMRRRAPRVKDEASHIYSLLFRDDVLSALLEKRAYPFYVRSWVGGDKDGHPGVNEKTLIESLSLSRSHLVRAAMGHLRRIQETLDLIPRNRLHDGLAQLLANVLKLKTIRLADAKAVRRFRAAVTRFGESYRAEIGADHPSWLNLIQVLHTFPGMVVPLELRESSDMLKKADPKAAIYKMLQAIERMARGGNPRWYARGFIISMTMSVDDVKAAVRLQNAVFNGLPIPVIPLFENAEALKNSCEIVRQMTQLPQIKRAARENWGSMIEIMVGYSDSAKESGALWSRWSISRALPQLEERCEEAGLTAVFFHGSGGSIDRGGGSIDDQMIWWPKAALRNYKVTVQGEMVERSLASPAIARRQVEKIGHYAGMNLARKTSPTEAPELQKFVDRVAVHYRAKINSPEFLRLVETSTPYAYLSALKIGSRPSKRAQQLTVQGLRAIPWILCWTQTRLLFPTWWGIGAAWAECSDEERALLRQAFRSQPVFRSYMKALGFTLAKINLNVWRLYLESGENAGVSPDFQRELDRTKEAFTGICGETEFLWYRPWLAESVALRSAMIHPLNLLQILAIESRDLELLRVTVAGIASGMLTTG